MTDVATSVTLSDNAAKRIGEILRRAKVRYTLRIKQLYHDREEVTAYLGRVD